MQKKITLRIVLMLVLFSVIGLEGAYAQQSKSGQAYTLDPEVCALMLRKGKESFARARYNEAKDLFRKAIQADPTSQKAWSYYDLAQMYSVAEQFKNHGRIVQSSAPTPEKTAESLQPQPAPVVTPAVQPEKVKRKPMPAKKEKPVGKEKPAPSAEPKKVDPAQPAPAPTPAPGGFKILKDEGC
jgi:outer membrane biosynthesis protein TonB